MPKRSKINESVFPNSSPAIIRSSINKSNLSNLTHADSISRSSLNEVTVTRNPSSLPSFPTTIKRSQVSHSTVTNISARRCKLTHSTLSNVYSARFVQASNSTLDNVTSMRRCKVKNTSVTDNSSLSRSQARDSVVAESAISRSSLERSRVYRSRLRRASLKDCDVSDCIVIGTDFKGMVLRNGVWKNGKLVGSLGEGVVAEGRDGVVMDVQASNEKKPEVWMKELASESEAECSDIESETDEDLPPPYTA